MYTYMYVHYMPLYVYVYVCVFRSQSTRYVCVSERDLSTKRVCVYHLPILFVLCFHLQCPELSRKEVDVVTVPDVSGVLVCVCVCVFAKSTMMKVCVLGT